MKLTLTAEQLALQSAARRLFEKECPSSLVRELRSPEGDPRVPEKLWDQLQQMGVIGLPFDSEMGGEDGSLFDLGLIYQEAGRALCPTVLFSTMLFGLAINNLGAPSQAKYWIPKIASGSTTGTTGLWDFDHGQRPPKISASHRYGSWHLSGTIPFVADADIVDYLLLAVTVSMGTSAPQAFLVIVPSDSVDLQLRRMQTFGHDVQCRVTLSNCRVDDGAIVGEVVGAETLASKLDWLRSASVALQCMEMVGGAQAVLDRTVAYVSNRTQFGRPIGSFQAVQHHVANMRIAIDAARLTAYQALWWVSDGSVARREVAIAKLRCNDAYSNATLMAHQLHGGMGYLRESDLHMWSERAKVTELRDGTTDVQLAALGAMLDAGGPPELKQFSRLTTVQP